MHVALDARLPAADKHPQAGTRNPETYLRPSREYLLHLPGATDAAPSSTTPTPMNGAAARHGADCWTSLACASTRERATRPAVPALPRPATPPGP